MAVLVPLLVSLSGIEWASLQGRQELDLDMDGYLLSLQSNRINQFQDGAEIHSTWVKQ